MNLDRTVLHNNIRNNGTFATHREQFEAVGFDYTAKRRDKIRTEQQATFGEVRLEFAHLLALGKLGGAFW